MRSKGASWVGGGRGPLGVVITTGMVMGVEDVVAHEHDAGDGTADNVKLSTVEGAVGRLLTIHETPSGWGLITSPDPSYVNVSVGCTHVSVPLYVILTLRPVEVLKTVLVLDCVNGERDGTDADVVDAAAENAAVDDEPHLPMTLNV